MGEKEKRKKNRRKIENHGRIMKYAYYAQIFTLYIVLVTERHAMAVWLILYVCR